MIPESYFLAGGFNSLLAFFLQVFQLFCFFCAKRNVDYFVFKILAHISCTDPKSHIGFHCIVLLMKFPKKT